MRLLPPDLRIEKRADIERLGSDHGYAVLIHTFGHDWEDWEVVREALTYPGALLSALRYLHPHPVKEAFYPDGPRAYLELCGAATLGGLLGVGATVVTCWALDVVL